MNGIPSDRPNQAPPVSLSQLREALAFITDQYGELAEGGKNVLIWLWEAIQGDFNENRSGGQIVFDAAISMIPGVDQVCDVRDLIANCKQIYEDSRNTWAWVGLALTLVGLIPTLGSLVKGVLKIFFLFVRRYGLSQLAEAVDDAMTWVITLLRKREVQRYLRGLRWDLLFRELARQVRAVRGMVTPRALLVAFDRGIALMNNLLGQLRQVPVIGPQAQATVDMVVAVRRQAEQYMARALRPVHEILDAIILRLELEDLMQRRGIVNARNVHFRGQLPARSAVRLMRDANPPPPWLSVGSPGRFAGLDPESRQIKEMMDAAEQGGWARLSEGEIKSFARGLRADTLRGPMKLYRVVSPGNQAAGSDWVTEEVWRQLNASADPKTAWRKHLAVWPDWNANGQFVVYELKAGEELKVWRGPAASQTKDPASGLEERYLEGGYEQIKFDSTQVRDARGRAIGQRDTIRYDLIDPKTGRMTPTSLSYDEYRALSSAEQERYQPLRVNINHSAIHGPFDTGWGYTDFDSQMLDTRLGLPNLPGQISQIKR